METITNKDTKEGTYLGDFLARDIASFCGVEWHEDIRIYHSNLKLLKPLWGLQNKSFVFWLPGGLVPVDWLVYRGMTGAAILVDILFTIYMLGASLLIHFLAEDILFDFVFYHDEFAWILLYALAYLPFLVAMGIINIRLYRKHVLKILNKRGLKNRPDEKCPELHESLVKEGKPSFVRVLIYRAVYLLVVTCIWGVAFTVLSYF
ncbi:MAG: hypothetical protein IJ291_03875 [Lachnospiraceae bacterium]|nr:hypothetical protein [Lachnospiraceae bacterium]